MAGEHELQERLAFLQLDAATMEALQLSSLVARFTIGPRGAAPVLP